MRPRRPFMWFLSSRGPDVSSSAFHDIGGPLGIAFRAFIERVCFHGQAQSIVIPLPLPIYRALRGGAKHRGRTPLPIARLLPRRRRELAP